VNFRHGICVAFDSKEKLLLLHKRAEGERSKENCEIKEEQKFKSID
jgi:hypothetical protein